MLEQFQIGLRRLASLATGHNDVAES